MIHANQSNESPANILCKSCGLCCTGHLFEWTKLRSAELDSIQSLGLAVIREPQQRGFSQPCPLWHGQCTVYTSPHYPRFCSTYKCKLLKELLDENVSLANALNIVQQAMEMIDEVESLLPDSSSINFREHLVANLVQGNADEEIQLKAKELLRFYDTQFGVNDLIDEPGAE
jgi:hypothetical protein